ncbi:MAG: acyltransferase [Desulfobacterales bacterium]|nr:acyltransferase [Desulfobacterales bacterium]
MILTQLGPNVPKTGNIISRFFGRSTLSLLGWKVDGDFPNTKKVIIIFAPHLSNWDALYTIATKIALGLNAFWMAKSSLFFFPLGILVRYLGGIPTYRNKKNGTVKQIANEFEKRDHLVLAIAPEGTRSEVSRWKTGFYNIAVEANVPILLMYLDHKRKTLGFGKLLKPTNDIDKDMNIIKDFYKPYIYR